MQPYQPMGPVSGVGPGQPGYPYQYPYPPMPPSAPRTLGTLSIVFGAIVGAFSFFGLVAGSTGLTGMMMRNLPNNAGSEAIQDYLHAIRIPSAVQSVVFLAMSVWLILIGVGQRRYRAWAARQSISWSILALFILVGVLIVSVVVLGPAAERMMEAMPHTAGMPSFGPFTRVLGIFGVLFYVPYPIILLVTFRKPAIVSAMQ